MTAMKSARRLRCFPRLVALSPHRTGNAIRFPNRGKTVRETVRQR